MTHPPDWPTTRFGAILADPPWRFESWSARGRDRCPDTRHYQVLALPALVALPLHTVTKADCCLFLWTVDSHLPQALNLGYRWGFTFKTVAFTWIKTSPSGFPMGLGYWTRGNPESCLLFTRGHPRRLSASVRQLLVAPRREHSRKPDETYAHIESLVPGPYLELFARHHRPNWTSWGTQLPPLKESTPCPPKP